MSEETPDKILELVEWVESKREQKETELFQASDIFRGEMKGVFFFLAILFLVVWILVYEWGVSLALQGLYDLNAALTASSALLPALAVVIACLALLAPHLEKTQ